MGIIVEFAFAVFCVLAGVIGMLWLLFFSVLPEWRIHERYAKTVCTLLDSRVVPKGEHNEASWERAIPFFMETLFYRL